MDNTIKICPVCGRVHDSLTTCRMCGAEVGQKAITSAAGTQAAMRLSNYSDILNSDYQIICTETTSVSATSISQIVWIPTSYADALEADDDIVSLVVKTPTMIKYSTRLAVKALVSAIYQNKRHTIGEAVRQLGRALQCSNPNEHLYELSNLLAEAPDPFSKDYIACMDIATYMCCDSLSAYSDVDILKTHQVQNVLSPIVLQSALSTNWWQHLADIQIFDNLDETLKQVKSRTLHYLTKDTSEDAYSAVMETFNDILQTYGNTKIPQYLRMIPQYRGEISRVPVLGNASLTLYYLNNITNALKDQSINSIAAPNWDVVYPSISKYCKTTISRLFSTLNVGVASAGVDAHLNLVKAFREHYSSEI